MYTLWVNAKSFPQPVLQYCIAAALLGAKQNFICIFRILHLSSFAFLVFCLFRISCISYFSYFVFFVCRICRISYFAFFVFRIFVFCI